jgi:uncharacterized protein (UPF0276 family)
MAQANADAHASIPARAGIGLRAEYEHQILEHGVACAWLEVHSENYFGLGGGPVNRLLALRERFPISLHGVGLGLGNTDAIDQNHLARLKRLARHVEPALISEHLCWNAHNGRHYNDLLPLPYTEDAVRHVAERITHVQDRLGRRILIENVSSYLEYRHAEMSEWEFLGEVAERADCAILLDVNNVYVNACNHGYRALDFITAVNPARVAEIHLAGHTRREFEDGSVLYIDTHDQPVCPEVWRLYRDTIERLGPRPTLIEWDARLPPLSTLETEAHSADQFMERAHARVS